MSPLVYQIAHVLSAILLVAFVISACADPKPERKKMTMIVTGILSLLVIVAGFGLISKLYGNEFKGWMYAKGVVWLILAALSGLAFRRSTFAGLFMIVAIGLAAAAVYLVYAKPAIFGH